MAPLRKRTALLLATAGLLGSAVLLPAAAQRADDRPSPRAVCLDVAAHEQGRRAFLRARLEVGPAQEAAWTRFSDAADAFAAAIRATCAGLPDTAAALPPLPVRLAAMDRAQAALTPQREALTTALVAFYEAATPAQREILDRPPGPGPGFGPRPAMLP